MGRPAAPAVRKVLPWVFGWVGFQAVVAALGWLTAWRKNEGDESSTSIRRTVTHFGLDLRPRNPQLTRVRVDLAMAGAEIDLTTLPRSASGIDVTVHALMGGVAIRVPADWRVWWEFRGLGGIGGDGAVERTHDEHAADVRIHASALFAGIGVEAS
jgi:hypothetical protein